MRGTHPGRSALQEGWVIANHILVSFHVAFISSILALPAGAIERGEVLRFVFLSHETVVSLIYTWLAFHVGIAIHELGHFLVAARLNALNTSILGTVQERLAAPFSSRVIWLVGMFATIPYGRALGIKKQGLNYYPDAPFNLAVAAAGPRASRNAAIWTLPPALLLLAVGLLLDSTVAIYLGRPLLGIGLVCLLDFRQADPGKYAAFMEREKRASEASATVDQITGWLARAPRVKAHMLAERIQTAVHPSLGPVAAPWQFRNCGMGGRHTEKEYPESNISMQEAMFLILRARDYQDAQELTVRLQNRLKEIIEGEEGCRVMGIGLEGGLAPYIDRGDYPLPEVRLWAMMRRAMEECGCRPGLDVAIALDPALSELEIAWREQFDQPDAVGQYLFWRDEAQTVLDREGVLAIYHQAIADFEIPILSIEDGFAEDDFDGWRLLQDKLGEQIFVIGDDLVTTNDRTIEVASGQELLNCALIKANQIGTLYETLLAMLVALGRGLELVVSHRSKSPNDDMEGQIALAVNALGLKAGGGANTERLVKYQAVTELMLAVTEGVEEAALYEGSKATVRKLRAFEEPTNAGIPTVGAVVELIVPDAGVSMRFKGATPLGTSAGTGEAIHLVDATIEQAEHREVIDRNADFFEEVERGVMRFRSGISAARIQQGEDEALVELHRRAMRYGGKGCMSAVDNAVQVIAPWFEGRNAATMTLKDADQGLLGLELRTALRRDKLRPDADLETLVGVMQRKQNLGMNAILSVSLALARAIAHVQGRQLYELLRQEMMVIIDRLANSVGVEVAGNRWSDYVAALRASNEILQAQGRQLHAALRAVTGLYTGAAGAVGIEVTDSDQPAEHVIPEPAPGPARAPLQAILGEDALEPADKEMISAINAGFHAAFAAEGNERARRRALLGYLEGKGKVARKSSRWGLANNRLFHREGQLLAPYLVGDELLIYLVTAQGSTLQSSHRFPLGTIYTDRLILDLAGFEGELVDLELDIFIFEVERIQQPQVQWLLDIAAVLRSVNDCTNRNQAVYLLRCLVARLCNLSTRAFVGTKNLQPEVNQLTGELVRYLNNRLSRRFPFLTRILVRNLPVVIGKPNVIDRLWNDTIDLAEVHVRGSAIVNELRRVAHHALGPRTLRIARAYEAWLRTGDESGLHEAGFEGATRADIEARGRQTPLRLCSRVVEDLEKLMGTSGIVDRLERWQESYGESLLRCEFGSSLFDELGNLVNKGIRPGNRWVFYHHLSILRRKAEDFSGDEQVGNAFLAELDALRALEPDAEGFDADATEQQARAAVHAFVDELQAVFERPLLTALSAIRSDFEGARYRETFATIHELRRRLIEPIRHGGFTARRYHLCQLDCLLEEMGYLSLRHVAALWSEGQVDLPACLEIIRLSILNLKFDGVWSQELHDLGRILARPGCSEGELLNVLDNIARFYHRLRQRVIVPFEAMQERLDLDDDQLRLVLANMQRYMHDLNSMVSFTDIASACLRERVAGGNGMSAAAAGGDAAPDEQLDPDDAFAILHLSQRQAIARRIETDGGPSLRDQYGSKASGLLYISHLGVPTRDGFVVPTWLPRAGLHLKERARLEAALAEHLAILEADIAHTDGAERRFGSSTRPLLLAVRGGSVFSMPGMLVTVVFVGMNDEIAEAMAEEGPWRAWDSYRRFLASFASAAWGIDLEEFDLVEETKRRYGVSYKKDLPWEAMREIVEQTKSVLRQKGFGERLDAILADPMRQLIESVYALYASWNSERTVAYREIKGIDHRWHTAAVVQEMAFGNCRNKEVRGGMDEADASLTGVIPRTVATDRGVRAFTGEIKFSAAGDDLVAGVTASDSFRPVNDLKVLLPMLERRLKHIVSSLRRFMGTDQEVEFTVERGVLSVLQSRTADRRIETQSDRFVEPGEPATRGLGICGGGFRGIAAFDDADRVELQASDPAQQDGVDGVLMVLENPTPDDIPVILSGDGLLTARGGSTSHAAVGINGIDDGHVPAVMSATGLHVNARKHEAVILDEHGKVAHIIRKGDVLSIHGTSGEVYFGSREIDTGAQADGKDKAPSPLAHGRGAAAPVASG